MPFFLRDFPSETLLLNFDLLQIEEASIALNSQQLFKLW